MHIDLWTLGLQAINALVLIWLLSRFLFRPVAAIIAKRQATVAASLAEAESVRQQAAAAAAELAHRHQDIAAEADRILARARAAAEAERVELHRQAEAGVAQLETSARSAMERDRDAMRQALDSDAGELAVVIAQRLLKRLPERTVSLALFDALAASLAALSATERAHIVDAEETLEVITASAVDAADRQTCGDRLRSVLGFAPKLRFSVDPALLGGVELHGRHTLIRNSWRADLDVIRHELRLDHDNDLAPRHVA